jgi:hypothetical protein
VAHISPYVVIWTVLAAIGTIFSLIWLIETWADHGTLRRSGLLDDDLAIVSRAAVRNAIGRLIVNILYLAVGLEISAAEMGVPVPQFPNVFAWEFILAILVLTSLSYVDRLERRDLHRALSRRQNEKIAIAQVAELTAQTHQETLAAIKENTEITKQADEHATAAFHEANSVNSKIAAGNANVAALVQEHMTMGASQGTQLDELATVGQDTNERAKDLQDKAETLVDLAKKDEPDPSVP